MIVRTAAVDVGNDALKALFAGGKRMRIPNVIAYPGERRNVIALEQDPLDGLHVTVTSSSLSVGKITAAVGNLAGEYAENNELTRDDDKATSDQILVLLLTSLALDALQAAPAQPEHLIARYRLSTGLPMREIKNQRSEMFQARLRDTQHEVAFLDTPQVAGRKVTIGFDDVIVGSEGYAAMMQLVTDDDLHIRDESLRQAHVLIHDIGGQSTDSAVFKPNLIVDNIHSEGIRLGASPYLDEIIARVEEAHGYRFRSRSALVNVLVSPTQRNHVFVKGNRTSIQPIVDDVLTKLAQEEYRQVRKIWQTSPEIQLAYLIGGGSAILKDYLEKINQAQEQYPLHFLDPETSVWSIAQAYDKLARAHWHKPTSV